MIKFFTENIAEADGGGKAHYLSEMTRMGYNVPGGFVIDKSVFQNYQEGEFSLEKQFEQELTKALVKLKGSGYMVRSSAIGEDSVDSSFAGQLESFQSGSSVDEVLNFIKKCWASYSKDNVQAYEQSSGKKLGGMGVVVQKLIDPEIAGVIFTRNPMEESEMLIEFVDGHGENLVSGNVHPTSLNFKRKGGKVVIASNDRFYTAVQKAQQLEKEYGVALDIEWAIKDGEFYLLQSRPVTTIGKGEKIHWSNTNVNENYPDPISPLLYSIARESYYHYFKNLSKLFKVPVESIQRLEFAYANVIGVFACKMYYNMSSIYKIFSASPYSKPLLSSFNNFVGHMDDDLKPQKANWVGKLKFVLSVIKQNRLLKREVMTFETRIDTFKTKSRASISFDELKISFHDFIEIRMHSWYKASLADFFAMLHHGLLGKVCEKFYGKEATAVHNNLIQAIPDLVSSEPVLLIHDILQEIRKEKELYSSFQSLNAVEFWDSIKTYQGNSKATGLMHQYIHNWGFRCSGELMLTTANYSDEPDKFIALLKQYDDFPESDPRELIHKKGLEREETLKKFKQKIWFKYWFFPPIAMLMVWGVKLLVNLASDGIRSRERVRLKQALLYYEFKKVVRKIGGEFQKRGWLENSTDVIYLRYQEIVELLNCSGMIPTAMKESVAVRKKQYDIQKQAQYPDEFVTSNGGDYQAENLPEEESGEDNGKLKGMSACAGKVKARARVLDSIMEADKIKEGDILITRQTDPGWIVVFPLISGLAVERGGMLSHGAIVSREFGIPAIVGIKEVTSKIKDGQMIELNADNGEITLLDE